MINKKRIIDVVKKDNFLSIFKKSLRLIISYIFVINKVLIFQNDLENEVPKSRVEIEIKFRIAKIKDIEQMKNQEYGWDEKGKNYCINRLKKGDICILGIYDDKIISYIWGMKNEMEISMSKIIKLPKEKSYSYNGFVHEDYRGNKVHSAMINQLYSYFKSNGKRYVLSGVDKKNKPALKTKNKDRGIYKKIAYYWHIKIFRKDIAFINEKNLKNIRNINVE
jgi:ribosomal protein S18 acetylase RimI-like enzyme